MVRLACGLIAAGAASGCRGDVRYDKSVRLYLDDRSATLARATAPGDGWYVLGVRRADGRFDELTAGFAAVRGDPMTLRRDGPLIRPAAAGFELPAVDAAGLGGDAVYLAWAHRRRPGEFRLPLNLAFGPDDDAPRGGWLGALVGRLVENLFDPHDRDEDADDRPRQTDRGERYGDSTDAAPARRRRTRD